ncbi:YcnI family protein [Actinospica sp. MGRD01-02]|uniref:YcnI family protein n=1 Tax=Actinospica acidithermotolerans TaxID=2828514 RepID=A0A941IKR6_9ACTN|nr:YcnI family protein [Actinospica acidithermotolerans]MBR7829212.1 YcnI family protein [Actinospica acidithermotolerans]
MLPSSGVPARRRAAIVGALTLAGLAIAATASAHVTVSPASLPQGSTAELTFKVPNEESKADTVSLQLQIPTQYPIAQVLAKPVPGWTIAVHTVTLAKPLTTDDGTFTTAVNEIDWTGGTIQPGQYQDFQISVDPLPSDTTQLAFKAVQTYSNGDVVRWIDLSTSANPDPDHPAPVLTLTPAASATATASSTTGATSADAVGSTGSPSSSDGFGVAGLVLGAIGAGCGVAALLYVRKTRRSENP